MTSSASCRNTDFVLSTLISFPIYSLQSEMTMRTSFSMTLSTTYCAASGKTFCAIFGLSSLICVSYYSAINQYIIIYQNGKYTTLQSTQSAANIKSREQSVWKY
ncbi:hypothetical protein FGO68_gene11925 [Halteria grandinella]|uniref:Uncharacterized protein n=1 Tax=Halteria grandinella TaxID=5974 RepID=A0A8J8NFX0_HALGN|nr:hypothetical protein FGO68_gene11925 [Halteria grandinella]